MKTAYIAVTANGAALAQRLAQPPNAVFIKAGHGARLGLDTEFTSLSELVGEIFPVYDNLVFIMAAGITVRVIAPYIVHKASDPAVVVIDERGSFVISLLSGHIGGANALTAELAKRLGAQPVITTATDVNNKIAADTLLMALHLLPDDFTYLKYFNGRLAAGQTVNFIIDEAMMLKELYMERFNSYLAASRSSGKAVLLSAKPAEIAKYCPAVFITPAELKSDENLLIAKPRGICAGIGCRRGTDIARLREALAEACRLADVSVGEITCLSSTEVKADEVGLLSLADEMARPIKFWPNEALSKIIERYKLTESPFVKKQIGVGNVCEAAALQMSQTKKILLPKTKLSGITVALAWVR